MQAAGKSSHNSQSYKLFICPLDATLKVDDLII